jgi:hypothetical protein
LISFACVSPSKLILLELNFSLVPGPLLLLASVALKYLLQFLCVEGNKCYLVFFVVTFFFCRGRKDFICREFSWKKEKRKTAYWRMQGDSETGDPLSSFLGVLPILIPPLCALTLS